MKKILWTAISISSGLLLANPMISTAAANNQLSGNFSPTQQQEIRKIIHDYLVANPEVLVEASQALQNKEVVKSKNLAMKGIKSNESKLFNDPKSPTIGNPNGNVMLVEFFDYQCGHCKEMQPVIEDLVSKNPNIKIIFKEFPIFGESSNYAAQAALAAAKQNKYQEFHKALFKVSGALSQDKVLEVAKSAGLNVEQLQKDMNDESIKQALSENYELAKALSLVGTPSFVLSNKEMTRFDFIPGAAPGQMLQQSIDNVGKK